MRVSVVGPVPPTRGGIAQHTANVARAFAREGHEVQVIGWRRQYPRILYGHDEIDQDAPLTDAFRTLVWWNPLSWFRARRTVNRHRSDILWIPWVTPFHALAVRVVLGAATESRVVHVHNPLPHEPMPFSRTLTRFGLRRADRLMAHADDIVGVLRDLGIHQPCAVIAHPPNLEVSPAPLPEQPPTRLLFLGFIRSYKGLDIALDALGLLPDHFRLTVAGEFWEDSHDLRARAKDTERVAVTDGYLPDEEMKRLLAEHHLLLCPYRSATQSGLVPLAFAAGRPVVATDVGGLAEAVVPGTNGELSVVDPAAFAAAIVRAESRLDHLARGALASASSWADYVAEVAA